MELYDLHFLCDYKVVLSNKVYWATKYHYHFGHHDRGGHGYVGDYKVPICPFLVKLTKILVESY